MGGVIVEPGDNPAVVDGSRGSALKEGQGSVRSVEGSEVNNLATDLRGLGLFAEAEKLDRETLDIRRRVLGPEHPETLISQSNLSYSLMKIGHYAEAEKLLRESLGTWQRVADAENWWVVKTMKDLAFVLSREGRYAEAEKLAADSTNISRRVFGPENPLTASSVYNLGAIEARRGKRPQALSLLRQAVDHGLPPSDALAMENNPDLKSLHGDPRFITIVANAKEHAAAGSGPQDQQLGFKSTPQN